jgi:hypothetical protein
MIEKMKIEVQQFSVVFLIMHLIVFCTSRHDMKHGASSFDSFSIMFEGEFFESILLNTVIGRLVLLLHIWEVSG